MFYLLLLIGRGSGGPGPGGLAPLDPTAPPPLAPYGGHFCIGVFIFWVIADGPWPPLL